PPENLVGHAETLRVVGEQTGSRAPQFPGLYDGFQLAGLERGGHETAIGPALDGFELGAVLLRYHDPTIAGAGLALRLAVQIVAGHKVGHEFGTQREDRGALLLAPAQNHAWQGGPRMLIDDLAIGRF